jgi:hypothetical protein
MQTNLWSQFGALVAPPLRFLVTVHAHNADGTSSASAFDGGTLRVQGQLDSVPPYNAWVQDGRLREAAPNLPLFESAV